MQTHTIEVSGIGEDVLKQLDALAQERGSNRSQIICEIIEEKFQASEPPRADFPRFCAPEEEEADERERQAQFNASKDALSQLAAEARAERKQGKTLPLETVLDD